MSGYCIQDFRAKLFLNFMCREFNSILEDKETLLLCLNELKLFYIIYDTNSITETAER
jgi:hypothetical protein